MSYEEKKQQKIIRYRELSKKYKSQSDAMHERAQQMASVMQGEPIKRGHSSEKRHRTHIQKMNAYVAKSVSAENKAKEYESKANATENYTAINSDDPNAKELLQKKIFKLENLRETYKKVNKIFKNKSFDLQRKIDEIQYLHLEYPEAKEYATNGVPDYKIRNNTALISATKKRLEQIETAEAIGSFEETINGSILEVNQDNNRVMIFFKRIPDEANRDKLKRAGFHWSPTNKAWQRKINRQAINEARRILQGIPAD